VEEKQGEREKEKVLGEKEMEKEIVVDGKIEKTDEIKEEDEKESELRKIIIKKKETKEGLSIDCEQNAEEEEVSSDGIWDDVYLQPERMKRAKRGLFKRKRKVMEMEEVSDKKKEVNLEKEKEEMEQHMEEIEEGNRESYLNVTPK
jgi:hypothetical protein